MRCLMGALLVAAGVASPAWAAPGDGRAPAGDEPGAPPAASSGLQGDQELETLPPVDPVRPASAKAPGAHTVKRGDTLWDISRKYFHDPYRWVKIWALNPEITNPHWIFPGQALRLNDGKSAEVAASVPAGTAGAAGPGGAAGGAELAGETGTSAAVNSVLPPRPMPGPWEQPELKQIGFVDEGELKAAGVINGSMDEKILLGTGDHAYVEFPVDKQPKGGARFSVYQVDTDHPIREPYSNMVLGYLVHVYGDVVIDNLTDRPVANGRLVDLVAPVERGYLVGPHVRRLRSVRPKHNQADMTARIVASVEPNMLIANQMFVVLNRGSRHGVELGNRFLVLRQGDGIRRVMEDWEANDHRFPPHAVAEIVAVDVQNETTVGWISRGTRELHTGDLADMRSGY